MSRQDLKESISIGIPIADEFLFLSHDEIVNFIDNSNFEKQFQIQFDKYLEYLSTISGIHNIGSYYKYITISLDEKTYNCIFTFSHLGVYISLANMLNCLQEEELNIGNLKVGLKKLKHIKSEKELEENFPFLYQEVFLKNKKYAIKHKMMSILYAYESAKKDFIQFNKLKEEFKRKGLDLEREYLFAKSCFDFQKFISCAFKHFSSIIDNYYKIQQWMVDNPIDIRLNINDTKKVFLYIIYRQMENMSRYAADGEKLYAQKSLVILENLIKKYQEIFPNDNTEIQFDRDIVIDKNTKKENNPYIFKFNLQKLLTIFEKQVSKYSFLKRNIMLPNIDKNLTFQENMLKANKYLLSILEETVIEDKSNGAIDITDEEIEKKITKLEEEIKSENITEENRSLKKLVLEKIKMVLVDIKPKAKQTGIGIFSNYYIYFYPNGMVAIDKIDSYGALYIMPVHIYKEARYKKSLTEVRSISGVKFVEHRKKEWLIDAKKYILNGTEDLTEKDIMDAEIVASIDFPYTLDKMNELQQELEREGKFTKKVAEETKKRIEKIKRMEKIDSELHNSSNYDLPLDEFNSEEEELIKLDKTFDELYEYWKQQHHDTKVRRNPVVAAITKNRARDIDGNYCCEMCSAKNFESSAFDSHHMIALSEGGIDNIYNTICLCPNCHRYVHSGKMTLYQKYDLLKKIRTHIIEDNPEYLFKFDKMISPIAENDEYYQAHKEEIDHNFSILWNGENPKLR